MAKVAKASSAKGKTSSKAKIEKKVAQKLCDKNREVRDIQQKADKRAEDAEKTASETIKQTLKKATDEKKAQKCNSCSKPACCSLSSSSKSQVDAGKLATAVTDLKDAIVK